MCGYKMHIKSCEGEKNYLFSESAAGCSSPSGFSSVTFDWSSSLQGGGREAMKMRIALHASILVSFTQNSTCVT